MQREPRSAREEARLAREREWLEAEALAARSLTDTDRVRILCDLIATSDAIRAAKDADDLAREEHARRELERPGKERYRALAERLA
jgi:hypothetical protein